MPPHNEQHVLARLPCCRCQRSPSQAASLPGGDGSQQSSLGRPVTGARRAGRPGGLAGKRPVQHDRDAGAGAVLGTASAVLLGLGEGGVEGETPYRLLHGAAAHPPLSPRPVAGERRRDWQARDPGYRQGWRHAADASGFPGHPCPRPARSPASAAATARPWASEISPTLPLWLAMAMRGSAVITDLSLGTASFQGKNGSKQTGLQGSVLPGMQGLGTHQEPCQRLPVRDECLFHTLKDASLLTAPAVLMRVRFTFRQSSLPVSRRNSCWRQAQSVIWPYDTFL
jgi:hypothetical protein